MTKSTPTPAERLGALAIPAVDDYLAGAAKGAAPVDLVRLLDNALLALLVALETAQSVSGPQPDKVPGHKTTKLPPGYDETANL